MFFLFVSGLHKKGKGLEEKLLQPNTRMSAAEMLHFYLRTSIQFLLYHCGPFKTDELQTYHKKFDALHKNWYISRQVLALGNTCFISWIKNIVLWSLDIRSNASVLR